MLQGEDELNTIFEQVRGKVLIPLRGFAAPIDDEQRRVEIGDRIAVPPDQLPVPRLVEWVLGWALGAPRHGKDEKRAWVIPFTYEGASYSLGLYKFGLRLFVPAGTPTDISGLIIRKIDRAVRVVEGDLLTPWVEQQVRAGHVTVENQYHLFHNMYWHFRAQAESHNEPPAEAATDVVTDLAARLNAQWQQEESRFHATVAMLTAYFSLLEHLLVILAPFVNPDAARDPEALIRNRWRDKFRALFDITADPDAKRIHDALFEIAEEYRNTYDHGGFGKKRGSMWIHLPGGSPVPATLSEGRQRFQTTFFPVAEPQLTQILKVLDDADAWLCEGPASYGMLFADSGIDVAFDTDWIAKTRAEMTSMDEFGNYLEGLSRWLDNQANMDW